MTCFSCFSSAEKTVDSKPAPVQTVSQQLPAAVPVSNGQQVGAKPKTTSSQGKPVAASATGAGQTPPMTPVTGQVAPAKQSSQQARPLRQSDTPAFLAVSPTSPIKRPTTPYSSDVPAGGRMLPSVRKEPPTAGAPQPDLNSPPSFKGFLTAKAEQEAAAELDGDTSDIWTPRNMALGNSYASNGSLRSAERMGQSPAKRPGTPPREVRHAPSSSLELAEVAAAHDMVRGPPPEAQVSQAAPAPAPRHQSTNSGGTLQSAKSGSSHELGQAGSELYEMVGVLGEGRTGVTKLMRDRRSGELVAAKWVQHTAGETLSVETEREIVNHRRLLHPNIVRFREVYATDEHLVIVMDYASGGHLQERIDMGGVMPEATAKDFFRQLVDGMVYCHRSGIVHRNLRMENMLLDGHVTRPVLKISGFGYSKAPDLDSAPKSINMVSPAYLPPEMLMATRNEGSSYDGRAVDVWSAGVLLFNMLTGIQPFTDPAEPGVLNRKLVQRIVHCVYELPAGVEASNECRDLLKRIFVADPRKRIDSYSLPSHPWLAGTLLPKAEPVVISKQSESDISLVMERARKRRAMRQAAHKASRPQANFNEDLVDM